MNGVMQYLDLFGVTMKDLRAVASRALAGGASYADLYFENTQYRELSLRDGSVQSGGIHCDWGVGIRTLDGERTGYSYCETISLPQMLQAADAAASIASGNARGKGIFPSFESGSAVMKTPYRVIKPWSAMDWNTQVDYLKSVQDKLLCSDSRIKKVIARLSSSDSDILMYNNLGQIAFESRPMGSVAFSIIFSDGKVTENRSASRSFRSGGEMLSQENADSLVKELLSGMDDMLCAGRPKGGKMSVVMGAGASGILLHEAMGHAFEADFNRKGQSVFSDKIGSRICPEGIDIVDDATLDGNRGSILWDDELVPGQKTYMVKDGILTSYLHDRISAAHYGIAPTGNGRRESFRYPPIPRMRLTYMENGNCQRDSIIAEVKKGIFVDEFSNGQVKIGEGDFTFYVKKGYLIENGHFTAPVKDINVIGNGPRALSDIKAVGNDLKIDNGTWTCGKDQSVAVGCGMPTVLVEGLTVGGE